MMSAFWGGVPAGLGITGVTRLTDTAAPTGVTPWLRIAPLLGVVTSRNSVRLNVPGGSPVMSSDAMRSTPSEPRKPLDGRTLFNLDWGLILTVNGPVTSPGMWTGTSTSPVLPNGTGRFGLVGEIAGAITTGTTTELAVKRLAHGRKARTR